MRFVDINTSVGVSLMWAMVEIGDGVGGFVVVELLVLCIIDDDEQPAFAVGWSMVLLSIVCR